MIMFNRLLCFGLKDFFCWFRERLLDRFSWWRLLGRVVMEKCGVGGGGRRT